MSKTKTTRRATTSKDGLTTRDKRTRKRYLCDYIQKHRELTPADKAVGRLLVNWHNEKAGHCYASIEALANELELSRKTIKRAVGKLHRLGLVRRDIGGGWDHGRMSHRTSQYFPAFELVTHKDTGRPRKNLPPSVSTSPETARTSAEVRGQNVPGSECPPTPPPEMAENCESKGSECPPNSDSDSSGGSASPASPSGSTATRAPQLIGLEKVLYDFRISEFSEYLGISPDDFLALVLGLDGTHLPALVAALERETLAVFGNGSEGEFIEALDFALDELDEDSDGCLMIRDGMLAELTDAGALNSAGIMSIDFKMVRTD